MSGPVVGGPELDPVIVKGLRLLMSKREEAVVELRQLFEETVRQRMISKPGGKDEYPLGKAYTSKPMKSTTSVTEIQSSKRPLSDKTVISEGSAGKRARLDETAVVKSSKSKSQDAKAPDDDEDFSMDYVMKALIGVVCAVCKKAEPTNLLECNTCRSLYHADCHQPSLTGREAVYDPRNVWYCSKCKSSSGGGSSSSSSSSKPKSSSSVSSPSKSSSSSSRHSDSKMSSSSTKSSSKDKKSSKSSSFSSLAPTRTSSSSSSSSSTSAPKPSTAMIDAQKRMESMKKKAAEKRKLM